MTALAWATPVIFVAAIVGLCQLGHAVRHRPRGHRRLTSWQRASSTIMWAEFEATQPMPGIDMDGRWPQ